MINLITVLGIGVPAMAVGVLFVRMGDSYKKRVLLEEEDFDFLVTRCEPSYMDEEDEKTFNRIIGEE